MATNPDIEIISASANHVQWIISMAKQQGWNPGNNDSVAFQQADPAGYFVGLLDGKPICCAAGVKFNQIAIVGYYVVEKEYRGRGYGLKIFQHAMNYLSDSNVRVDGLLSLAHKYESYGFKMAHVNVRYAGVIESKELSCPQICQASSIPFDKLVEYDARFYADQRKHFLATWINIGTTTCLAYVDNDIIQGFGAIRKSVKGYRIGPLYAEKLDIAEALLCALCQNKGQCNITLDFPLSNSQGVALAEKLKLDEIFKFGTLYTDKIPDVDLSKIYSFTCH